jgi:tetratricopeptide (TPR) repeat protein
MENLEHSEGAVQAAVSRLIQAESVYTWFEAEVGATAPSFLRAVRSCAIPLHFDRGLALHILHSNFVGLNGNAQKVLQTLVDLPFVHREGEDLYTYDSSAQEYFDKCLRQNDSVYDDLNQHIVSYLAGQRQIMQANGIAQDTSPIRELQFQEIYHTLTFDQEQGVRQLHHLVETAPEGQQVADNWAASRLCQRQRPFLLGPWQVEPAYFEGRYHYFRGDYQKAQPIFEAVRASGQQAESVAVACHLLGVIYCKQSQLTKAETVLLESRELGRTLNLVRGEPMVLNTLGGVYRDRGHDFLPQAAIALEEAVKIDREQGNLCSMAMSLNTLGGVYKDRGHDFLPQAATALEEAVKIFRERGDVGSMAMVLNTLGGVYKDQGHNFLPQAATALEEAVKIWREQDNLGSMAMSLNTLGGVYKDRGHNFLPQAATALEESVKIFREQGNLSSMAMCLNTLGGVYKDLGHDFLPRASEALEEARDIFEDLKDRGSKAMVLNTLGGIYRDRGRAFLPRASEALEEARDIFEDLKDRGSKAMVLITLGGVYRDRDNLVAAENVLLKALDIGQEIGKQSTMAYAWNQLGRVYEDLGGPETLEKAHQAYLASRDINLKIGNKKFADKMDQAANRVQAKLQKLIAEKS